MKRSEIETGILSRPDDLVLVGRSIAPEGIRFGDIDGDDPGSKEPLRLRDLVQESINGLTVHLSNPPYREGTDVVAMSMPEWRPLPR